MEESKPPQYAHKALQVAVLTTSYPLAPGNTSGIFVARLLEAMPDTVSISVITPASRIAFSQYPRERLRILPTRYAPQAWQRLAHEPGGVPVALREVPWLRALLPALVATLTFRTWQEARTHQILHANWAFNGCVAGVVGVCSGCHVLTSLRGEDVSRAKKSWFARQILRLAIVLSDTIVAVSTDMAKWLQETFPSSTAKITVVENGVDAAFLAVGNERCTRPHRSAPIIVCAGSLIPRKGHAILFRALARCTSHAWRLQLAGEGTERDKLVKLAASLGLTNRIEFLGELPPEAMPDFLSNADLFVLPSLSEGRPNALLEAMAAGLPVVASSIDGVMELVEDGRTGLLFPPGDHQRLETIFHQLLQDLTTRSKLGMAAHLEISCRQLTWEGAAKKYASLYQQLFDRT